MQVLLSRVATLLLVTGSGVGCGGGDGGGGNAGPGPDPPVLTTLQVTPTTAALFTVAPGNTVTLSVDPFDQNGDRMTGVGSPSFSSGNGAVATVGSDGSITAVGAGTTEITTSLTVAGVTETATTTVTVQVAGGTAAVAAPGFEFQPGTVDVSAGGEVTWSFAAIPHTVTFTSGGAPANVPELQGGSASRTFPSNGTFNYRCSIHAAMNGVVRVH